MEQRIAVIGAGVSGLTCAVLLAERGYDTTVLAEEIGDKTTSAAAGAIWYPYDVEPFDVVRGWALESFRTFEQLAKETDEAGVSMVELRTYCRRGTIPIPEWAVQLGASIITPDGAGGPFVSRGEGRLQEFSKPIFADGFAIRVPLIDTTIYLKYLAGRLQNAGGEMKSIERAARLTDIPSQFSAVINCAGIGARSLVPDPELEPHRGQVVIVPKLELSAAIVCDDAPLMYAVPRTNDCLFGGSNDVSDNRQPDRATTDAILMECSRVLGIAPPPVLAERVGLRPFRRSGVRLESERLGNRTVIHNYGHGGAGFTLSWGCAEQVLRLMQV